MTTKSSPLLPKSIKTLKDCFKLKPGSLLYTDPRSSNNCFMVQKVSKEENYKTFTKHSYEKCEDVTILINQDNKKIMNHSYSRKHVTNGNSLVGAFTGTMILTVHLSFLDLLLQVLTIDGEFVWVVLERVWEDGIYEKMENKKTLPEIKFKSLSEKTKRKQRTSHHFLTTQEHNVQIP